VAAWALRIFSLYSGDANACVAAGAIPQLVAALKAHAADEGVCQYAARALGFIADAPGDVNKNACAAAGAIPLLKGAQKNHAALPSVVRDITSTLKKLTPSFFW
jgi:hypothetical protein